MKQAIARPIAISILLGAALCCAALPSAAEPGDAPEDGEKKE